MTNKDLFKQAIADAHALREAAVANAKAALEESFTPQIMSMLEKKLSEEDDAELEEMVKKAKEKAALEEENVEEAYKVEADKDTKLPYKGDKDDLGADLVMEDEDVDLEELFAGLEEEEGLEEETAEIEENDLEEEFDLEEILAELEEDANTVNEEEIEETMGSEKEAFGEVEELEESAGVEEEIAEVTVGELRDMIQQAIKDAMGGAEDGEEEEAPEMDAEEAPEGEEELDIDLDGEEGEEEELKEGEEPVNEVIATAAFITLLIIGGMLATGYATSLADAKAKAKEFMAKNPNLSKEEAEALVAANDAKAYGSQYGEKGVAVGSAGVGTQGMKESDSDLEEAVETVETLRKELNEVNLLNAKLIYVNRLFKDRELTETHKVKVVNAFDRVSTLSEAKNLYETMKEHLDDLTPAVAPVANKKTTIKESVGFASKPMGAATPAAAPVVETDSQIERMRKLAGLI